MCLPRVGLASQHLPSTDSLSPPLQGTNVPLLMCRFLEFIRCYVCQLDLHWNHKDPSIVVFRIMRVEEEEERLLVGV